MPSKHCVMCYCNFISRCLYVPAVPKLSEERYAGLGKESGSGAGQSGAFAN